jgi:glycosyltransferase involved in cell wall biosynthesis
MASLFGQTTFVGKSGAEPTPKMVPIQTIGPFQETTNPPVQTISALSLSPSQPTVRLYRVPKKLRVMICGTHPQQYNGYSRVVYEICRRLGKKEDIELTIYGFQNFHQSRTHREPMPNGVIVHDAAEAEPQKRAGFGEKEFGSYLKSHPQDIVIIYNDMSVVNMLVEDFLERLAPDEIKDTTLVCYIDQVYLCQKRKYIEILNKHFQHIFVFTEYWGRILQKQPLRKDIGIDILPHGFDHERFYPVPLKLARAYFQLSEDAFVVLNLNRNQPRKRWDLVIMGYALVIKRHYLMKKTNPERKIRPIKLFIGTAMTGCWDLNEIMLYELNQLGVPEEIAGEYLTTVPNPQQLSDFDINVLMSAADISTNLCDGEGWGLTCFESCGVGVPCVASKIGGHLEFLSDKNSILIDPKWNFFVDQSRDAIGGKTEVCDPKEFAEGIWKYYMNPLTVKKHGKQGRMDIVTNYQWDDIVEHFYKCLLRIAKKHVKREWQPEPQ